MMKGKTKFSFFNGLVVFMTACLFIQCSKDNDPVTLPIITPEIALDSYLDNRDETHNWMLKNSLQVSGLMAYDYLLTSQEWHGYTWKHQLTVFIPDELQYDKALLWITGGSLENGEPRWTNLNDDEALAFASLALSNHAVTAVLRQVPNQPLFNGLTEDELISYTLNEFRNDRDYSWPLLFPMVKSAVRAMDAIEDTSEKYKNISMTGFLVAGASKRGWTTWLTAASDHRVSAIAPAVIDILNMPVNLDYQLEVWGDYSPEIQDYVDLGIPQDVHTQLGGDIAAMIDPFSHRHRLIMPKMIFIGTNDPYWPVDAVKNYFDDLPGNNFIHYVPNAGHDLNGGEEALQVLSAFYSYTLSSQPYPECSWEVTETGSDIFMTVTGTSNILQSAYLWSAYSEDRDFRDESWSSISLPISDSREVHITTTYPETGFMAFYIDLEYTHLNEGNFTLSTRVFVTDKDKIL